MSFTSAVSNGVTVTKETVTGGTQIITSGGKAVSTTVTGDGALQIVSNGGSASATKVDSEGKIYIYSGGTASASIIDSDGKMEVYDGGLTSVTTVSSGGHIEVYSGGSAVFLYLREGAGVYADTGATIKNGTQTVAGTTTYFSLVNGVATNFIIGGRLAVLAGNSALGTKVVVGGTMTVASSGLVKNTEIAGGRVFINGGSASSTSISSNGSMLLTGGIARYTSVNSLGKMYVESGEANNTTVENRGSVYISSGASANYFDLLAGGYVHTNTGATITNGTNVRTDGYNNFSIIDGVATNFFVRGTLDVLSGHSAVNTFVSYGDLTVYAGGTISGGLTVLYGDILTDMTLEMLDEDDDITLLDYADLHYASFSLTGGADLIISGENNVVGSISVYDGGEVCFSVDAFDESNEYAMLTDLSGVSTDNFTVELGDAGAGDYILAGNIAGFNQTITVFDYIDNLELGEVDLSNDLILRDAGLVYSLDIVDNELVFGIYEVDESDVTLPTETGDLQRIVAGQSALFTWSESADDAGIRKYVLEYSLNADFTSAVSLDTSINNLSASDIAEGMYYWRVKAVDMNFNESAWSEGDYFIVDVTGPSAPAGLSGSEDEESVQLDWNDATDNLSGIAGYIVEYSEYADFNDVTTLLSVSSDIEFNGIDEGMYFWRVKAIDGKGNESSWSDTDTFILGSDSIDPSVPNGLSVTVTGSDAAFDWGDSYDSSGVRKYIVEYADNANFSGSFSYVSYDSEIDISGISDGIYYWRVKTVDVFENESGWSEEESFTVDTTAPEVPDSLTAYYLDNYTFLGWSVSIDNLGGDVIYRVEYGLNRDGLFSTSLLTSNSGLVLSDMEPGFYDWRVCAVDETGNESDWAYGAFTLFSDGEDKFIPDSISEDSFYGQCVAVDGDSFVVGAGFDELGNPANDIYIYTWNDSMQNWDETLIHVSDVQSSWSNYLDLSGETVIVGNKGDSNITDNAGCAFIYQWNGIDWVETVLTASDGEGGDQFGWSAAIDGYRAIVGARYDDDSGIDAGAVYVYEWNGISWNESKILASDGANKDAFGSSVDIDGDTMVVGARNSDAAGSKSGSVYVYNWNGVSWDETKLTASDGAAEDFFGGSVAIDGDIIVVGASGDDDNGENSGSVYIYRWNGETWEETKLTASDGQANDNFGWSVAVADGDTDTIIVGAHDFDCNGPDSGCAYLYQWNGISWIESKFSAVDVQANDNFGWSLDIDGETIVVGSRKDDAAGDDSGSAYLFELDTVIDSTPPNVPADLVETILGDEVLLDWSDSVDASGGTGVSKYIVEYADNLSFINTNEMIVVNSELTLSGLENGSWYWRVQAVDVASNVSDWSEVYSFEVDVQTLDSLTGLAVTVSGDDISLDWDNAQNVVYGVKNYIIEYSQDAAFTAPVETTSTASALNIVNIAEGNWYWRVRVEDNNAGFSAWTQGENFFVDVSGPSVPTIVSDDVDGDSVVLDWSASTDSGVGLSGYVVQYADNSDFAGALENTLTSSELSLGGLVDGVYYWRVKSYDGNGNDSDWSEEDSFIVDTIAPSVPTGLFDYVDGNDVSLTWYAASDTDGGSGVWEYVVEYADNASFDSAVKMVVDTNELQLDNIDYGTYYWKVQTVDGSGNESAWSVSDTFVTDDTVGNSFADSQVINVDEAYSKAEYVGIGDACDMYSFDVASAGEFDLAISNLSAKTKLNIYVWNGKKYKKIKSTGSKFDKITDQIEAHIDNLMLDEDTYYIEIISGDKGKGKCNTEYSLDITPSYLPEATDNNNWQDATEIFPDVSLDGFVGFGDAVDYYKFEVDSLDVFDFELAGDNKNAKMTVYEWDESKDKYKKVATASLKNGEAMLDDISLDAGLYYVEVLSKDKGKGKYNTEYELNITTA